MYCLSFGLFLSFFSPFNFKNEKEKSYSKLKFCIEQCIYSSVAVLMSMLAIIQNDMFWCEALL